jgi:hypothetical protein
MGSYPGHSAQYAVCSSNLCLYVDRRWHTPSTGELYQSDLRVVTVKSIANLILRDLLDFTNHMQHYCKEYVCGPAVQVLCLFSTSIITPKLKSIFQPQSDKKFKIPYLQTVNH